MKPLACGKHWFRRRARGAMLNASDGKSGDGNKLKSDSNGKTGDAHELSSASNGQSGDMHKLKRGASVQKRSVHVLPGRKRMVATGFLQQ
mmetsp:Transcript_92260/g.177024  ORF Transcript_92260/g.177024 Transcript_92260/m.177024 type:complete len:90 (-) Transcript_92260:317-586(-)